MLEANLYFAWHGSLGIHPIDPIDRIHPIDPCGANRCKANLLFTIHPLRAKLPSVCMGCMVNKRFALHRRFDSLDVRYVRDVRDVKDVTPIIKNKVFVNPLKMLGGITNTPYIPYRLSVCKGCMGCK